ncbi:alpha/beta hydrolase [Chryseobacterium sp. SC28]|uniref:alpha/beta hydrolase n=1 Tax=Chryseobacterium sp. SC28 TaxID=2268028 RepID=UPI000F64D585|nr:alpha/beta hydrolase-fold protein [Chryseobacterium sp. SC28]RRQ46652.1 carbohydrate esterase [Chryseobacterium sp. SC28]
MEFFLKSEDNDDRPIFITGNFNKWNPKDPKFELEKLGEGNYYINIPDEWLKDEIEFKFTKGGWENVEIDRHDNITPNRKVKKGAKKVQVIVEKWRVNWGPFKKEFFPKVELIDEAFYIPQLDKTRKVWALLPFDYYDSDQSYPVLYLQDAQNLFNEGSAYGNWEIDKKLALLAEYGRGELIVIAIEHGDDDRIKEYIFDHNALAEEAEGKKYLRFVTDTLKPLVDQKYRTKKDRENTGIGGSSLGALISIYGGFLYPEVYSKLLIFSPSLWVEPNNNFPMMSFSKPFKIKVYLYGGRKEGSKMVSRIKLFEKTLKKLSAQKLYDFEVKTSINDQGTHQEFFWSQEFPRAVEWLYIDSLESPVKAKNELENDIRN